MNSATFLGKLQELQKPVFTSNDIQRLTGFNKAYLKVYLFRLKQRQLLREVEKGKYSLSLHPFIIASNVVFPSYISLLSAYFYYGLTTQIPKIVQVISPYSKKELKLEDYKVQFIKIPLHRMFGYAKEKFMGKYIFVAEKEKAIIDSLYLPRYCPLDETYTALQSKVKTDALIAYAVRMDSIVLLKRLGYLLELCGIDIYTKIKSRLNDRYDCLDPDQARRGKKSEKWKLVINTKL